MAKENIKIKIKLKYMLENSLMIINKDKVQKHLKMKGGK